MNWIELGVHVLLKIRAASARAVCDTVIASQVKSRCQVSMSTTEEQTIVRKPIECAEKRNLNLGQNTRAKQSGHTHHGEGIAHRKDASRPRDTTHHRPSVRGRGGPAQTYCTGYASNRSPLRAMCVCVCVYWSCAASGADGFSNLHFTCPRNLNSS